MVKKLRSPAGNEIFRLGRVAGMATVVLVVCLSSALNAQTAIGYDCPLGVATPGAIGSQQLQRGGPLMSGFQAVEVRAPRGVSVSLAAEGFFEPPQAAPLRVGLLIGPVYRIRVTNIPFAPGVEVFPTIEVVDRLYAPAGEEMNFPIPIELTAEELQMAADGKFITRVVYLENPHAAVATSLNESEQSYFDVSPGESPLAVALEMGRPMAVLRLGGRVPGIDGSVDMGFLCGCPPFIELGSGEGASGRHDSLERAPVEAVQPGQGMQGPQMYDAYIATRPRESALISVEDRVEAKAKVKKLPPPPALPSVELAR